MAALSFWLPADRREFVDAVLVSVKNPAIIALTILWMIGTGYCLMVAGDRSARRPDPTGVNQAGSATGGDAVR